jgi:hypothetical protein
MDKELDVIARPSCQKMELTLVYPYCNNTICLERQLQFWTQLPRELAEKIEIMIIDDGSPQPAVVPRNFPNNLTCLRIKEDVPWNQPGARNLGLKLAEGEWIIATDIDHLLNAEGLNRILSLDKDSGTVYFFSRRREDGSSRSPHPNSFLVSRKTFWDVGGYDEDFCGHYGYDDSFLRLRFERSCRILLLREPTLIELEHGATPGLSRSRRHNRWLLKRKRRRLEKGKYENGRTVRFEWELVGRWRMDTPGQPPSRRSS